MRHISERGKDWIKFHSEVLTHIEEYTVPQYGDRGSDQCSDFTLQDFVTSMKKYLNRFGRNTRPGQDRLDMLKVAHYAQMLSDKLNELRDDYDKIKEE